MDKQEFAKKIIKLRIATRKGCLCEDGEKRLIGLKTKMLFLLNEHESLTPNMLIAFLNVSKPNLTILGQELEKEGLIERSQLKDKRNISYRITSMGKEVFLIKLNRIADYLPDFDDKVVEAADVVLKYMDKIDTNLD